MKRTTSFTIVLLLLTAVSFTKAYAQSDETSNSSSKVDTLLSDIYSSDSSADSNTENNDSSSDSKSSDTSKFGKKKDIQDLLNDKGFTGTLDPDDPDSDAYKEKQVFGDDEAVDDEDETDNSGATHTLKFDYSLQVVVTDTKKDVSNLEIDYNVKFEQPVEIKDKRYRTKGHAEVTTDIIGVLAGNELFTCKLDIQFDKTPVDIMTRYNHTEETETTPETSELAVQLKFKKADFMEDWLSNCTGVDGSELNTKGEKEKYLLVSLESISPSLDALLFKDYDPTDNASLDLLSEPILLDDSDISEQYAL